MHTNNCYKRKEWIAYFRENVKKQINNNFTKLAIKYVIMLMSFIYSKRKRLEFMTANGIKNTLCIKFLPPKDSFEMS